MGHSFLEGQGFGLGVLWSAIAAAIILIITFAFLMIRNPHLLRVTVFWILKIEFQATPDPKPPRAVRGRKVTENPSKKLEDA